MCRNQFELIYFTLFVWLEAVAATKGLKADDGKADVFKSIVIMGMLVSFNPPRDSWEAANGTGWIVVPITSQGESKSAICAVCWIQDENSTSFSKFFFRYFFC